MKTFFVCVIF